MAEFTATQLEQLTQVMSKLLDKKLEQYLEHAETRFDRIETETDKLKSENKKLKARVCALESFSHKTHAEIIGFPSDSGCEPLEVVTRLAKQAGIDLKPDHLKSAEWTGPTKMSNGAKCQDITVDFERVDNCDIFLKKVGSLRKAKNELRSTGGYETTSVRWAEYQT